MDNNTTTPTDSNVITSIQQKRKDTPVRSIEDHPLCRKNKRLTLIDGVIAAGTFNVISEPDSTPFGVQLDELLTKGGKFFGEFEVTGGHEVSLVHDAYEVILDRRDDVLIVDLVGDMAGRELESYKAEEQGYILHMLSEIAKEENITVIVLCSLRLHELPPATWAVADTVVVIQDVGKWILFDSYSKDFPRVNKLTGKRVLFE